MSRLNTSSRKVRHADRKPSARSSSQQVRRRAAAFKLESLEERTMLSTTELRSLRRSSRDPTLRHLGEPARPLDARRRLRLSNQAAAGKASSRTDPNVSSVLAAINGKLPANDPKNAAQPLVPSAPSTRDRARAQPHWASKPVSVRSHHGVTLQSMVGPVTGVWSGLTAVGAGASPSGGGTGPGGGIAPAQIAGAYGLDLVMFGGIQGDGTGQTIAIVDNGDNPGFLNSSDPNYSTSALAQFDAFYGIPQLPSFSFQKYDQYGNPTSGVRRSRLGPGDRARRRVGPRHGPGRQDRPGRGQQRQLRRPRHRPGERGRGDPRRRGLDELRCLPRVLRLRLRRADLRQSVHRSRPRGPAQHGLPRLDGRLRRILRAATTRRSRPWWPAWAAPT